MKEVVAGRGGTPLLIFAYGSNMATPRLQARVASAQARHVGFITAHELRFHKRSIDGSAKADAYETGRSSDVVWGVVFEVSVDEKHALDTAEGLHHGYNERLVTVQLKQETVIDAAMYFATDIDASLRPYSWYVRFVIAGAREHQLPAAYVEQVERIESIVDQDRKRHDRNWSLGAGAVQAGDGL